MKLLVLTLVLVGALVGLVVVGPLLRATGPISVPEQYAHDGALGPAHDAAVAGRLRPESYAARRPDTAHAGSATGSITTAAAQPDDLRIPYPLYPNGRPHSSGGQNGLKVVVYRTDDAFADVDAFYRLAVDRGDMPRLEAMRDRVRYSAAPSDDDPWATTRPGIVIHELGTAAERHAAGAARSARTSIIMRF